MRQPLGERRYRAKNKAAWDEADPSIHSWLKTERDLTSGRAGKAFGQTAAANQEQSSQVEGGGCLPNGTDQFCWALRSPPLAASSRPNSTALPRNPAQG